jgi:tetratricopeptide (TPR) repeat protein
LTPAGRADNVIGMPRTALLALIAVLPAGCASAPADPAPKRDPARAEWLVKTAVAKVRMGDAAAGGADLDAAVAADPEYVEAYRLRAELKYLRGDAAGSIADLDEVIKRDPLDALARANRGYLWAARREGPDFAKAVADMDEAVRLAPGRADLLRKRSEVHRGAAAALDTAGNTAEARAEMLAALSDLQAAAEASPDLEGVHADIGAVMLLLGDRAEQAEAALTRALAAARTKAERNRIEQMLAIARRRTAK